MEKQSPKFDQLMEKLESEGLMLKKMLKEWSQEFEDNPSYSLEWSGDAFKRAARLQILETISYRLGEIENREDKSNVIQDFISVIDNCCSNAIMNIGSTSTSVPSNEMSRLRAHFWNEYWSKNGIMSWRRTVIEALEEKYS